jgi:hypothetical protein
MRHIIFAILLLAIVALARQASPAEATPIKGGVDPQATLTSTGRSVALTGTVDCSESGGRPVLLRVTLTQPAPPSTVEVPPSQFGPAIVTPTQPVGGVVAEGLWQKQCSDTAVSWSVTLNVAGDTPLTAGPADVAVLDYTDAVQWIGTTQLGSAGR